MFQPVRKLFKSKRRVNTEPLESDVKLATARLMLEVVKADGHVDKIEIITMTELLRHQFNLHQEDLNSLFALISKSRPDEDGLTKITRTICETWGNAKRMKLLENLWLVALADQTIDKDENNLVRKLAGLLCLNEMQIFQTQENAKLQMGIEDF
jgi:uncharacterized tellurite resistance protein B-like protein